MSTEKKAAPILSTRVGPFTLRLVNGHFVRVPKFDQLAATDATRPASALRQDASPHGDGGMLYRGLRLIDGRFVTGPKTTAPLQVPPNPAPTVRVRPAAPAEPSPDSWAYAFRTRVDPLDLPPAA